MIRVCIKCCKTYGIKRPLLNFERTHGLCNDCLRKLTRKVTVGCLVKNRDGEYGKVVKKTGKGFKVFMFISKKNLFFYEQELTKITLGGVLWEQ